MDVTDETFTFEAELWLWQPKSKSKKAETGKAKGSWYFITLPQNIADWVTFFSPTGGWGGSVPVKVTVGESIWQTSVFRHNSRNSYILPIKAAIRKAEGLTPGTMFTLGLRVRQASAHPQHR